ncbi:hypothetical protein [Providencia hangzhouensis]|uniref:hypothetical protein n=1 Tax=Providencia hangzhouensis TaxID=3031799 RepID=UPI00397A680D
MSDCNGNSIIQPIVQDLNALGERIGKAIDSATADRDVQLLEGALWPWPKPAPACKVKLQ